MFDFFIHNSDRTQSFLWQLTQGLREGMCNGCLMTSNWWVLVLLSLSSLFHFPGDNNGWPHLFDKYFGMPSYNAVVKSNMCRKYWSSPMWNVDSTLMSDLSLLFMLTWCRWLYCLAVRVKIICVLGEECQAPHGYPLVYRAIHFIKKKKKTLAERESDNSSSRQGWCNRLICKPLTNTATMDSNLLLQQYSIVGHFS